MFAALALLAMLIELAVGYPQRLVDAVGHPVTWMGALIRALDRRLNNDSAAPNRRRAAGIIAVLCLLVIVGAVAFMIGHELSRLPYGIFAVAVLGGTLIAQKSLHRHVAEVAIELESGDIAAARTAVSRIVGRDTNTLDEAGVARAAIESLAENFSDAVVAPVLWLFIAALPGIALYKAINTADSIIGHLTPRYRAFGWAAARLDDLVNLPASRLSALLLVAAAALRNDASAKQAWRTVWRDASHHRSPNAGYPEAAMAGALGLSLAGPRVYGGVRVDDAKMGNGRWEANASDIRRALALYRVADGILIVILLEITFALIGSI
ncbi:MAG TPA: adenosylcobinamide-phosphate synthase CbiB [Xanthobacteraceae bacterium]|nr:adenosylcobinamide-phosphate synthase CbiB [Xanthobacteraceae bacterium]